jgi:hypothetical protein
VLMRSTRSCRERARRQNLPHPNPRGFCEKTKEVPPSLSKPTPLPHPPTEVSQQSQFL